MRLEIYVASDCLTCAYAYEVAAAARQIAGIEVAVIDLDQSNLITYGHVVFTLGQPTPPKGQ